MAETPPPPIEADEYQRQRAAAKAAGYSDEDIDKYLGGSPRPDWGEAHTKYKSGAYAPPPPVVLPPGEIPFGPARNLALGINAITGETGQLLGLPGSVQSMLHGYWPNLNPDVTGTRAMRLPTGSELEALWRIPGATPTTPGERVAVGAGRGAVGAAETLAIPGMGIARIPMLASKVPAVARFGEATSAPFVSQLGPWAAPASEIATGAVSGGLTEYVGEHDPKMGAAIGAITGVAAGQLGRVGAGSPGQIITDQLGLPRNLTKYQAGEYLQNALSNLAATGGSNLPQADVTRILRARPGKVVDNLLSEARTDHDVLENLRTQLPDAADRIAATIATGGGRGIAGQRQWAGLSDPSKNALFPNAIHRSSMDRIAAGATSAASMATQEASNVSVIAALESANYIASRILEPLGYHISPEMAGLPLAGLLIPRVRRFAGRTLNMPGGPVLPIAGAIGGEAGATVQPPANYYSVAPRELTSPTR